jgi:hypothetical protein
MTRIQSKTRRDTNTTASESVKLLEQLFIKKDTHMESVNESGAGSHDTAPVSLSLFNSETKFCGLHHRKILITNLLK